MRLHQTGICVVPYCAGPARFAGRSPALPTIRLLAATALLALFSGIAPAAGESGTITLRLDPTLALDGPDFANT